MRRGGPLLALAFVVLLAGCGSMNVVSDGGDARLMLHGYDPVAYFTDGRRLPMPAAWCNRQAVAEAPILGEAG